MSDIRVYPYALTDQQANAFAMEGSSVQVQPCNSTEPGQVRQRRFDGSLYNPSADSCLELPGWATENGTALGIWQCSGGPHQRWHFEAQTR
nr:RICIN domain-containing protein [Streptomyces sp. NBC_00974]